MFKYLLAFLGVGAACVASAQDRVWEFAVTLSSETSSENYVRIYLDADLPDLAGPVNGHYVRVGHDQKQLCLFRQSGPADTLLLAATPNSLAAGSRVSFRVERTPEGEWFLFADYQQTGSFTYEGQCVDDVTTVGPYSGLVKVCSWPDTSATSRDALLVERIYVPQIPDYQPQRGDILISEVMADPDPVVGQPAYEYVELFNRSGRDIPLNGWVFQSGSVTKTLPSLVLPAGQYLVLTHVDGVGSFPDSIRKVGLFTNTYSIANESCPLALLHSSGDTVDRVTYEARLHTVTARKNGGWSVERDSLESPELSLWHSCEHPSGGTPGVANSWTEVIPDDPDEPQNASAYDVVINEIMADPDPVTGLPAFEYVELYNRTDTVIRLQAWTFSMGTTVKVFPACSIQPGGYLLLAHADAVEQLSPFGQTLALFTSKTSLTNDGQALVLKDAAGTVISAVTYAKSWYGSAAKSDGGWSLEQKNPQAQPSVASNWLASADLSGGTPGRRNSHTPESPDEPGEERRFVFSMASDVFSPNQDGYQDQLEAFWRCDKPGYKLESALFNTVGQRVRWLVQHQDVPVEGALTWDGKNDSGALMPVGVYILYVRFYHSDGTVRDYKWPCVLSLP